MIAGYSIASSSIAGSSDGVAGVTGNVIHAIPVDVSGVHCFIHTLDTFGTDELVIGFDPRQIDRRREDSATSAGRAAAGPARDLVVFWWGACRFDNSTIPGKRPS